MSIYGPFTFDSSLSGQSTLSTVDFLDTLYFQMRTTPGLPTMSAPPLPPPQAVRAMGPHDSHGVVIFEHIGIVVKFGLANEVRVEEAQALQAIRRAFLNGEVTVPELYGWKVHEGYNYIYMSLITGSTLRSAWSDLDFSEKESITDQLRNIVSLLRSIPQQNEDGFIGSISRTRVQDLYFRGDFHAAGPFHSIKAFNDQVQFLSVPHVPLLERVDPYRHLIPDQGKVYFTHADLNLTNIMVSGAPGSRRISGILDWEQTGWYPEYWEYFKLHLSDPYWHEWRRSNWVGKVMVGYEAELTALGEYWHWWRP